MEIQGTHRGSTFVENVFQRKSLGILSKLALSTDPFKHRKTDPNFTQLFTDL